MKLDAAWVHEDTNIGAKSDSWKVGAEGTTDETLRTMGTLNFTPNDTELAHTRSSLFGWAFGLVDISDTLAQVEVSVIFGGDTIDLDESRLVHDRPQTALERHKGTLRVKPATWENTGVRSDAILCMYTISP